MTTATLARRILWTPTGIAAWEAERGKRVWRVERMPIFPGDAYAWKAWSRLAGSPVTHVIESVRRDTRQAAMSWCASNMDLPADTHHLIGKA